MRKFSSQLGFTMIELLIVITILGILAVAVLSAINPIEQINRGRDTGSQSDAEQLLSAIDRYNAFQGYYPWQGNADDLGRLGIGIDDGEGGIVPVAVGGDSLPGFEGDDDTTCTILERLSTGNDAFVATGDLLDPSGCTGAQEIKDSFVNRLLSEGTRTLYLYNRGQPGDSTYVCFIPQSGAFRERADERCVDSDGVGLPDDLSVEASAFVCGAGRDDGDGIAMSCLP